MFRYPDGGSVQLRQTIAVDILHERKVKLRETVLRQDIVTRFAIYLLAVFAIIIFGIYGPEFSASSFIYQEF